MPVEKQLPANQFDNAVRWIKTANAGRLTQLVTALDSAMGRLGQRGNYRLAVRGTPDGSDQFEAGSLIEWLGKIQPEDTQAIGQVKALHATAHVRITG